MSKTAVIVIDMVRDFVDEQGKLSCGEAVQDIVSRVVEIVEQARQRGDQIVFLCDRHRPDDQEFAMFPPHCLEGTAGADVIADLDVQDGDIVMAKRKFSAFAGTDLDLTLRELNVSRLIIVGVCTNICVLYTAADARMRAYEVVVYKDAVASFDQQAHDFALGEMERTLGVTVI